MLKRTPLYEFHVSAGARMVDFAGWEMPLLYGSIIEEHEQTRRSGSAFDVSHMGRIYFTGKETAPFLDKILTRNVADQKVGQSRYSLICNDGGGILDDVIVSRDSKNWLMVCNAANRKKIVERLLSIRRQSGMDVDIADETEATAMVAIQGPKVIERLASVLPIDIRSLKHYQFASGSYMLTKFTIFRSGYSGEDGLEVIVPARMAMMAIKALGGRLDKPDATIKPAGLGARDTLRMEAGMPLYGHELSEGIDPLSAGLGWAVDLKKDFSGVEPLRVIAKGGPARKLVGLELEGRRIARPGTNIVAGSTVVGQVTSGGWGPTVQKSIAMGYVDAGHAAVGTVLAADLKGEALAAKVVKLPFYKRTE